MVRIDTPAPAVTALQAGAARAKVQASWPAGTLLQATVNGQANRSGQYPVMVGKQQLWAHSERVLQPGQTLQLQVTGIRRDGLPELRAVNLAPLRGLLRQRLPQQASAEAALRPLLNLPSDHPASQLLNALPGAQQLSTGEAIQRAILNSGLFFESQLQKRQQSANDIKAQVLKLLSKLNADPALLSGGPAAPQAASAQAQQLPPAAAHLQRRLQALLGESPDVFSDEGSDDSIAMSRNGPSGGSLKAALEGWLARLDSQALLNLENSALVFELPIRDEDRVDVWQFSIGKESGGRDEEAAWLLTVKFDMPPLGAVFAHLRWQAEQSECRLHFQQADTMALFEQYREELQARLGAVQGVPLQLQLLMGIPDTEDSLSVKRLLETKA